MPSDLSVTNVPELWAGQGIMTLRNTLVMAELVFRRRDFRLSEQTAELGDTINTRLPVNLTPRAWAGQNATDDIADREIVVEVPKATNVAVVLDNLEYTSFIEEDLEASIGIEDIREQFIDPALVPLAERIDETILTQLITGTDVEGNAISEVQIAAGAGSAAVADDVVEVKRSMDADKCPASGRNFVFGTEHHADLLKDALFVQADQSGGTTALEQALLGRKFNFQTFMSQQVPDNTNGPQSVAFHKNAIAYVSRPLRGNFGGNLGVMVSSQSEQGYSVRVTASYNHRAKGVDVSFDLLWGTKLLHAPLAKRLMG